MRKKIVAGNWKMNGRIESIRPLLVELKELLTEQSNNCGVAVFPPAIYLPLVSELLNGTAIAWGAQNVYSQDSGAYTGEISSPMLKDYGCRYVLAGHSERRNLFGENEKNVAEKFHHAKEHGMIPVLCIGETLQEREQGRAKDVLAAQLGSVAKESGNAFSGCIVAYEPVWAIGTGKTASPEQAQEMHEFIRSVVAGYNAEHAQNLTLLYGGSVNEKNAQSLFAMPDVDGGLIGGASLNARQFVEIVKCIN
ncbi:triose-phosphate isomerase [Legionella dresdenensis]|uniref:Triosephosphate isomerase n=1 Tax=Legionella dresdenensis TaxID=450200 RepID=A0ABV8CFA9_9GAMM